MPPSDFSGLVVVGLEQIDLGDRTLAISPEWFPVDDLTGAIRRVGLLCPPHLQPLGPHKYRVISGFRRLKAASSLGLNTLHCLVRSGDPGRLFVEALIENASVRPLHLLEKANAVWKLTRLFSIAQARVISEFLPVLGVRSNRFEMNRLLELNSLPLVLQQAIVSDGIEADIALGAARWGRSEQDAFINIVKTLRPGFNRQKELFGLLDELRERDRESITQLLSAGPCGSLDALLCHLRSQRFPKLTEYQQVFQQKKAALRLPPEVQFQIPPFFEGEKIHLGFAVRTPEELKVIVTKLQDIVEKPELRDIFELL